jgi:hypothetical protein
MLSRCLNPECGAPFRYLREGRIFSIEQTRTTARSSEPQRSVESYWLCGTCSSQFKVTIVNGTVVTRPTDMPSIVGPKTGEITL